MKVMTVVGARPQFIKAAVISRLIDGIPTIEEQIVHTGQHYDISMSDVFFEELHLPRPKYNLNIGSASHAIQTAKMLMGLEELLCAESPDIVIVYGDTNSTLAGALASAKLHIPVAHVEAGLRSFDRTMPEEINRCVTDHLASWHFCPTDVAVENLRKEDIRDNVFNVGDVMLDALRDNVPADDDLSLLRDVDLEGHSYVLCTIHRAGNTDHVERFRRLWESVNRLAAELPVVLPLHPRTRKVLNELGLATDSRLHLVEPVSYRQMLSLESHASLIVTDSGGVQKESYIHGVPCLTLRETTEWTENR